MNNARAARQILRAHRFGVLCTLSKKFNGHPFGSITPYLVDHDGSLVILISSLAEHTRNIRYDSRVSLVTYSKDETDIQSQGRVTVMGVAEFIPDGGYEIGARYLRYFPEAQSYLTLGDFSFCRIVPQTLRYIGGFGKIHWVSAANCRVPPYPLVGQEEDVIAHMNADHRDTMRRYCHHFHQCETLNVEMLGIDCDGFDVRTDDKTLRFNFVDMVLHAQDARHALVAMSQRAR